MYMYVEERFSGGATEDLCTGSEAGSSIIDDLLSDLHSRLAEDLPPPHHPGGGGGGGAMGQPGGGAQGAARGGEGERQERLRPRHRTKHEPQTQQS